MGDSPEYAQEEGSGQFTSQVEGSIKRATNETELDFRAMWKRQREINSKKPPYYNIRRTVCSLREMYSMTTTVDVITFTADLLHLSFDEVHRIVEANIRAEESGLSENTIKRRLWTRDYAVMPIIVPESDQSVGQSQNPNSCCLCLEDYRNGDKIAMLYYCSHEYHANCIKKWLLKKNLCPICKRMALLPEHFPDWTGDDIRHHQEAFSGKRKRSC